jgi:hypothetical protein
MNTNKIDQSPVGERMKINFEHPEFISGITNIMQFEKNEALLFLIAETLILVLTNQFGEAGKIEVGKPIVQALKGRLIEIDKKGKSCSG